MKRIPILMLLLTITILFSCSEENIPHNGVVIKGNIPKKGSSTNQTDSFNLDDVSKVLFFSAPSAHNGVVFEVVNLVDGHFEIGANLGTAGALIFLTSNYEYIGNLSVV